MKKTLLILSISCLLASGNIYFPNTAFAGQYTINEKTNITQDYIYSIEGQLYTKRDKAEYKEAMQIADYLIDLNKKLYGEESSQTAFAYLSKGILYSELKIYDIAKNSIDEAIKISQLNPDDTILKNETANALFLYYFPLNRTYENIKNLDSIDPAKLNIKNYLDLYERYGSVYMTQKDFKKAISFFKKYNTLSNKTYGSDNLNTLHYYLDLIYLSSEKSQYKDFNLYYPKVEELYKKLYKDGNINQYATNINAALSYYIEMLDKDTAIDILDKNYEKLSKTDDINIKIILYEKYFELNKETNNYGVLESYIQELEKLISLYPENSLKRLTLYEKKIDLYNETQQYDKVISAAEEALKLIELVKDYVPGLYGKFLTKAGEAYSLSGQHDKIYKYLNKAIDSYAKVFPENAYPFYEAYKIYGESLDRAGKTDEALTYFGKSEDIATKLLGKSHKDTADLYSSLAFLYSSQKDEKKALKYINKAIKIYSEIYGENHIKTYEQYINKYYICTNLSLNKEAEKIFKLITDADKNKEIIGFKKNFYFNLYMQNAYKAREANDEQTAADYAKKALENSSLPYQENEVNNFLGEHI